MTDVRRLRKVGQASRLSLGLAQSPAQVDSAPLTATPKPLATRSRRRQSALTSAVPGVRNARTYVHGYFSDKVQP